MTFVFRNFLLLICIFSLKSFFIFSENTKNISNDIIANTNVKCLCLSPIECEIDPESPRQTVIFQSLGEGIFSSQRNQVKYNLHGAYFIGETFADLPACLIRINIEK